MLVSRNVIVTLSLGAALVAPGAASASSHSTYCPPAKTVVTSNHDKDVRQNKADKDDHSHAVIVKKVETKKVETKTTVKTVDKDDHQSVKVSESQTQKSDNDKTKTPCDTKVHKPTPKPTVTPIPGKGDANGVVLSAATTPVVKTAATLPVTGEGTDIALAVAAASAFGAYMVAKRRKR